MEKSKNEKITMALLLLDRELRETEKAVKFARASLDALKEQFKSGDEQ